MSTGTNISTSAAKSYKESVLTPAKTSPNKSPKVSNNFGSQKQTSVVKVPRQTNIDEFHKNNFDPKASSQWVIYDNKYPASIIRTVVEGTDIRFRLQTLDGKIITTDYLKISPFTTDLNFDPDNLNLGDSDDDTEINQIIIFGSSWRYNDFCKAFWSKWTS